MITVKLKTVCPKCFNNEVIIHEEGEISTCVNCGYQFKEELEIQEDTEQSAEQWLKKNGYTGMGINWTEIANLMERYHNEVLIRKDHTPVMDFAKHIERLENRIEAIGMRGVGATMEVR